MKDTIKQEINMTPNEYQRLAQRTVMPNKVQEERLVDTVQNGIPGMSHIIVAALKLNSESGELADNLVKHLSYGQPLDETNIVEECGDLLWYIALILEKVDSSMEACMTCNINKLKIRYPEKFTEEHAAKRLDKQ